MVMVSTVSKVFRPCRVTSTGIMIRSPTSGKRRTLRVFFGDLVRGGATLDMMLQI
jgi:hypothetical protein